jgi:aconitate hydratase
MAQKIVAGRASSPSVFLGADPVTVKVDQILIARHAARILHAAFQAAEGRAVPETVVAYDGCCIEPGTSVHPTEDLLARGVTVARAGAGFPGPVHLERFASPGRLCVTDEPRAAGLGGAGMLSLVLEPSELGKALATGNVTLRAPRSVQVLFTGKARPWVCARDIALELVRRGVGDIVRRIAERHGVPVVLELAGAAARLLSVGDRAVIAGIAPLLGAAAAIFASDDRTKDFLGDQRRSKAYRVLAPDAGAPCDDVVSIDIGAVDPFVLDESNATRSVRDLGGRKVSQVILGGDSGTTLRDFFTAAVLLKSKKVPPDLDFLLAVPSRQQLEVLSSSGALADLVATGARLIEPDARICDGTLYPPRRDGVSLRTMEPSLVGSPFVVASAETAAYAVATGEVGDPRGFKRPARGVTMPRVLPTDDVLLVRGRQT